MGLRFSKSIKLGNYLRLNLSKSGVSATLGKKGASVTLGQRGTFLNLSPAAVGIKGTGLSYRQKISGKNILAELLQGTLGEPGKKPEEKPAPAQIPGNSRVEDILSSYQETLETRLHLHRYAENVVTAEAFQQEDPGNQAAREIRALLAAGDADTVESIIGAFMNNLELSYDVRVNYEFSDDKLHVDLDLPEIEDFRSEYPVLNQGKIAYKKKTAAVQKEEYKETVLSLGIFLTAAYFNVSPAIQRIILSAFTTVRNKAGDLTDRYIYSVKFTRDIFERTDLSGLTDPYAFYLLFENRINLTETGAFRAVTPYLQEKKQEEEDVLLEIAAALKSLGFPAAAVKEILPELKKARPEDVSAGVKIGLKLLSGE